MGIPKVRALSHMLADVQAALPRNVASISVADILDMFHERGFGFLLFLFALPAALPLPGLGVNVIIATPLIFLTAQQALGRHAIWFPEAVKNKAIGRERFAGFLKAAEPIMRRLEYLIRPRLGFVTQGVFSNLIGAAGLVMALSILVPLPLTNTVPAMGIALMALGVLMRDGLAVVAGMLLGLAWVSVLAFVAVTLGVEGFEAIKDFIRGLL